MVPLSVCNMWSNECYRSKINVKYQGKENKPKEGKPL